MLLARSGQTDRHRPRFVPTPWPAGTRDRPPVSRSLTLEAGGIAMRFSKRWHSAQQYERSYWEQSSQRIAAGASGQLDWYRWRAEQLVRRLDQLGKSELVSGAARVIEIGSGPIGVAGFFPAAYRLLVDPLNDFYASDPILTSLRSPAAEFRTGTGEHLPANDTDFDLAIIENCLDHTHDVQAVMSEIARVLKPSGTLYLTVNNRSQPGYYVHRVLSLLEIDRGHPHTFTPARTLALLAMHGFAVTHIERGSFWTAWRDDLRAGNRKQTLKALLGISEYLVSLVAERGQRGHLVPEL